MGCHRHTQGASSPNGGRCTRPRRNRAVSFPPLERGPSVPVPQDLPSWLYPCFLAQPVSFPFRVSPQHPLVSSLVSRGNSVEISWFGPKISQSGKIPGYTWKLPCDRLGILPSSSVSPQILPQTSSQTQGNSRVARMEHQTPSSFPGNFRKRKVLGTLSGFLFGFRKHGYRPS